MTEISDFEVTEAMQLYGGSFVSRLGTLFQYADDDNQCRIKAAFPEYFDKYLAIVKFRAVQIAKAKAAQSPSA